MYAIRSYYEVYSELGKGTTFKILLPCTDAEEEAGNGPGGAAEPVPVAGLALVVDDDRLDLQRLPLLDEQLLRITSYNVCYTKLLRNGNRAELGFELVDP